MTQLMKLSPVGEQTLKGYEVLRLVGYLPTPKDKPTIGWGHTGFMPDGITPVTVGATITEDEAEQLFLKDTGWACAAANQANVERCIEHPPLLQNQFDAMVCLIFNIGADEDGFGGSHVRKYIVAGDDAGARPWWLIWNKQGGVVLQGLVNRRLAEWQMYSGVSVVS